MNRYLYFKQQEENELAHHGIKGQKWGIRRFQNEDGSYTEEGRKRYGIGDNGEMSKKGSIHYYKDYVDTLSKEYDEKHGKTAKDYDSNYIEKKAKFIRKQYEKSGRNFEEDKEAFEKEQAKNKAIGIAAVGTSLAVVGTAALVTKTASDINWTKYSSKIDTNYSLRGDMPRNDDMANDDQDLIIPANQKMHRVTPNKKEMGKNYDAIFLNTDDNTAKAYNQMYARGQAAAAKGKMFDRELVSDRDLKIAPGAAIKKAFEDEMMANPVKSLGKVKGRNLFGQAVDVPISPDAQDFIAFYGQRNKVDPEAQEIYKRVTQRLKDQGYDGMKDFNDLNVLGKGQAILFDPDQKVKDNKVNAVGIVDLVVQGLALKECVYYPDARPKGQNDDENHKKINNDIDDIFKKLGL